MSTSTQDWSEDKIFMNDTQKAIASLGKEVGRLFDSYSTEFDEFKVKTDAQKEQITLLETNAKTAISQLCDICENIKEILSLDCVQANFELNQKIVQVEMVAESAIENLRREKTIPDLDNISTDEFWNMFAPKNYKHNS